jgi:nitronate monooxygenase
MTSVLGIEHPIVQGPFGGNLSTELLAATVSERGGLGSYGAHATPPDKIAEIVRGIRARTSKPFAINLWVKDRDPGGDGLSPAEFERVARIFEPYFAELGAPLPAPPVRYGERFEEQVEVLLAAAPPVFSFVFGIPSPAILAACRAKGILTVGAATSLAEARALDEAGVDAIVATGMEAGGHRPSFLASAEESLMGTLALIPQVADRVKVPVIAAGGITDKRGVAAVLALGARAAQLGTAFLATEESGAPPAHKALLFSDRTQATTLTRAFSGRLARGLVNRWTRELAPRIAELPPYPIQSWFAGQLRKSALAADATDLMSLWCGQGAPNLRHRSASALLDALLD